MLRTIMVSRFSLSRRNKQDDNEHHSAELQKSPRKGVGIFRRRLSTATNTTPLEPTETQQQTRVVPMTMTSKQQQRDHPPFAEEVMEIATEPKYSYAGPRFFQCGAFCGAGRQAQRLMEEEATMTTEWRGPTLSEDPSVQESIECIVAATQGDLIDLLKRSDDDYLPTPSGLQQSLLKNRSFRREPMLYPQRRRVDTPEQQPQLATDVPTLDKPPQTSCRCCALSPPTSLPEHWPQRPLLLRPTPDSGTVVKGIRFVDSSDYLWQPGHSETWPQALARHWGKDVDKNQSGEHDCCEQCVILPLNNGQEPEGEVLVTDFESPLFVGTLIVRIRDCHGTTDAATEQDEGYFHGLNRRYQVVVRGEFKKSVPWTDCMTGFQLDRPAGKLPAKWMVNGALNVVRFFAPQLQTCIDSDRPYSLSPLGSTPQALVVGDTSTNLAASQQEPMLAQHTLLGQSSDATTSLQRAKLRKKHFDKLFAQKSATPVSQRHTTYTFEFLQHLFHFHNWCIELGSLLGSVPLAPLLDGQALQIMACVGPRSPRLWSFDLWHECLLEDAVRHHAAQG